VQRVLIVMPVYNEASHLQNVLDSITRQDFDHRRLYFIAVDGRSSDESPQILKKWLSSGDIDGVALSNPLRNIPVSLNLALQRATADDIVVRLDAHTLYGSRYLSEAIEALEAAPQDVGCIGAGHVPVHCTVFPKRIVEALYTNPMGLGGADYRCGDHVREVDHAYLGVWRPGLLRRAGGFNETLEANEDAEMSARIRALGYRILRVPLPCQFIVNRGPWGAIRQWHRYGYWRAKMLACNPGCIRRRHVIVPLAALFAVALAFSPWRFILVTLFIVYAGLVFRARAKQEPLPVTLATLVFFPALQFAYAVGLLRGLLTRRRNVRRPIESAGALSGDEFV
jgi:succinoglycan biosynthesis protein ExoA